MSNKTTPSSWVNDVKQKRAKRLAGAAGVTALGLAGATNAVAAIDTTAAQAEVASGKDNVEGMGTTMIGVLAVVVIFVMLFGMLKRG